MRTIEVDRTKNLLFSVRRITILRDVLFSLRRIFIPVGQLSRARVACTSTPCAVIQDTSHLNVSPEFQTATMHMVLEMTSWLGATTERCSVTLALLKCHPALLLSIGRRDQCLFRSEMRAWFSSSMHDSSS